ncbi:MAG: hypothetical protein WC562_05745 [Dehalococcoidia bacterium]
MVSSQTRESEPFAKDLEANITIGHKTPIFTRPEVGVRLVLPRKHGATHIDEAKAIKPRVRWLRREDRLYAQLFSNAAIEINLFPKVAFPPDDTIRSEEISERQIILLHFMNKLLADGINLDERILQRFVYLQIKIKQEYKAFKLFYGKFKRTSYGPFNEDLWREVVQLRNQGLISVQNGVIALTGKANELLNTRLVDKHQMYWSGHRCTLHQVYPLEQMLRIDIGSYLPE